MIAPTHKPPLIEARGLRVQFGTAAQPVRAVDGVDLHVNEGESVGLVGESGCGKTTLGRALLRLVEIHEGTVCFEGEDVSGLSRKGLARLRERAQMIFQDPMGSLNPRMAVGRAIEEVLFVHGMRGRAARRERTIELFDAVGLSPSYLNRYPHEFSGGQRQRIGIARALAVGPRLIIADEPVSALDVSVQVQILNLMIALRESMNLSYLFVAHDLAVVRYVCDRVVIMYLGRVVEEGGAAEIYERPAHPYTELLLASVPDVEKGLRARRAGPIPEKPATAVVPEAARGGCPFHPRCPRAQSSCRQEAPSLRALESGRRVACHFAEDVLKQEAVNV